MLCSLLKQSHKKRSHQGIGDAVGARRPLKILSGLIFGDTTTKSTQRK